MSKKKIHDDEPVAKHENEELEATPKEDLTPPMGTEMPVPSQPVVVPSKPGGQVVGEFSTGNASSQRVAADMVRGFFFFGRQAVVQDLGEGKSALVLLDQTVKQAAKA